LSQRVASFVGPARPFSNDRARVENLFALYEKLTAPLVAVKKKSRSSQE
jgi:hypothetical protein